MLNIRDNDYIYKHFLYHMSEFNFYNDLFKISFQFLKNVKS